MNRIKTTALIVAGGQGLRMKNARRKQYLDLGGTPVLIRTLALFDASALISRMVLVVPDPDRAFCRDSLIAGAGFVKPIEIVAGGPTRQASVFKGLRAMAAADEDLVVIHDAVRPFLTAGDLAACVQAAGETGAAILALPAFDTVKKAGPRELIESTVDRDALWLAQTPQIFRYRLILDAHTRARKKGIVGTDDAALLEIAGHPVRLVPGSRLNIKITTPEDLAFAEAIIKIELN